MPKFLSLAALAVFLPRLSWACAVCFGQDPSSTLWKGFYWGVLLLLFLPFGLAGTIAGLILYHTRKKRRLETPAAHP